MKNVILVSHTLIPSVLLCGHSQLTHLKKLNLIDYRFVSANKLNSDNLSWADIIVFVRSETHIEEYVSRLCKGKKQMIYILDDDLLNLPDYVSSAKYYKLKTIQNNIKSIMNNCDIFLTPSRTLLNKYGPQFKYSFLIDEPSINCVFKTKENEKIKIGFAGSIDRQQDINEILQDVLKKIISKYKDKIEIEFMGAKPALVDEYNLKYIPYQDSYMKYTKKMGELNWDIGLAPMPVSEFHSCKYFNKYVEYASFGIAGIYTKCVPYVYGINNMVNGLLVDNDKNQWIDAIETLINNVELRKKISIESIKEASTIYSLDTLSKKYLKLIDYENNYNHGVHIVIDRKMKFKVYLLIIKDKISIQGWKFPLLSIKYFYLKLTEKLGIRKKKDDNLDWDE